ncbi:uncharacterized protein LOC119692380 [Plutella xylostella]|uniref:uncharacterized protein LOC119692380 n=1 Tax=Plutella xylostella TaxID=51655 RepID=UPI00203261D4|nr:uncharacterized protein LOC119692380 [Plutella xylostella]
MEDNKSENIDYEELNNTTDGQTPTETTIGRTVSGDTITEGTIGEATSSKDVTGGGTTTGGSNAVRTGTPIWGLTPDGRPIWGYPPCGGTCMGTNVQVSLDSKSSHEGTTLTQVRAYKHVEIGIDFPMEPLGDPMYVCKCLRDSESNASGKSDIDARRRLILGRVERTENYLRDRRISELLRFLLAKIISSSPDEPLKFLETLLDDCMLFRANQGKAPVLFDIRHLEAIIRSFDPGERGWLSAVQVGRAFKTIGLTSLDIEEERIPTDKVLSLLKETQEAELYDLITAGSKNDILGKENLF